jgi:cob(I)alamin adenosyltransferase
MASHVTTKKGDDGTSRALSGEVLPKCHPVMECTGAVDSLRAQIALLRLTIAELLNWMLHCLFLMGTEVNDPENTHPEYRQDTIGPRHLTRLEAAQSQLEAGLQLPRAFIVAASNVPAAQADLTATIARVLERRIVALKQETAAFDTAHLLPFINRLSDFFFVLARHLEQGDHRPVDYNVLRQE